MTLQELSEACFRCPDSAMPATVYVFDDEGDAENWMDEKYSDANIAFVIRSDYKTCVWLKEGVGAAAHTGQAYLHLHR